MELSTAGGVIPSPHVSDGVLNVPGSSNRAVVVVRCLNSTTIKASNVAAPWLQAIPNIGWLTHFAPIRDHVPSPRTARHLLLPLPPTELTTLRSMSGQSDGLPIGKPVRAYFFFATRPRPNATLS
jgi:hypothetical protein